MDKVEMTLEDVGRMGASHYAGDVERSAAEAIIIGVSAFLTLLDEEGKNPEESVKESGRVSEIFTVDLYDHAETLNHKEVRQLLGLPRADRWSFEAD